MSTGTAFGKVILLGEHAVVHGVPAIAVGIDRGARATAIALPSGSSVLTVAPWAADVREDQAGDLSRALQAIVAASGKGPARIDAHADLPPGGGLGCSAALGVAIARALDPRADDGQAIERAMAWERIFHGNPSGIDTTVAALGSAIVFQKDRGYERLSFEGEMLLCVGSSGVASGTRAMVEHVARQLERRPEVVRKTFDGIHALVDNARVAIAGGDRSTLGKLMDLNQMLLAGLMLSTEEIERMCDLARTTGALGAKLTGAGGGGSVVALAPSRAVADRVIDAWAKEGFAGGFVTAVRAYGRVGVGLGAETTP
jgi:mevalonate kinase